MPRAFAISSNGHYGASWTSGTGGTSDQRQLALQKCRVVAGMDCQIYAVDERVVYAGAVPAVAAAAPTDRSIEVPALPAASSVTEGAD